MYTKEEKTSLIGLGLPTIFLRFGKSIIYLVFIFYGLTLTDNELLIGIAFGITALVQAALTIPFGFWSDKYGRKKMIIFGLIMFIFGSFLAAYPFGNIYILIFARFIQGISAIYSCVLAFISDIIPDSKRSRTLAYFSIFTGIVFSLGIILGPTISPAIVPYSFLFILSGCLGIVALIYLILFVPEPKRKFVDSNITIDRSLFKEVLNDKNLIISYLTTFISNMVIVAILLVYVPIQLVEYIPKEYTGLVLIPIFVFGMGVMVYTSKLADRGYRKQITFFSLVIVGIAILFLFISNLLIIILGLVLFFAGMAIIDPILPSFIITLASKRSKGTASGFYNVSRYLGEGVGPIVAGLIIFLYTINILLISLLIIIIISILLICRLNIKNDVTT